MHLLILGATGRTGVHSYRYALEEGHHVTILVRSASGISSQDRLTVVEGSVLSEADMKRAFKAAAVPVDAVAVFLNPRRASENPWAKFIGPPRLIAESTRIAARLLRQYCPRNSASGNPRLVVMNALGAGESRKVTPFYFRLFIDYSNVFKTYTDHNAVDAEIEGNCGNDIKWTIVLAVGLTDAGAKPVNTFRVTETGAGMFISRKSCAIWMLDVATGKYEDKFSNKRVIVSN